MSLIRFHNVSLTLTELPLFEQCSFAIEPRRRIAIIGRNGVGKSTLLKLITGELNPDEGTIERESARIASLQQTVPRELSGSVYDLVQTGRQLLEDDWHGDAVIHQTLEALALDPNVSASSLSGGQIRRALLAKALVTEPDLLLLDEPTNHLDLGSILWLEKFLLQSKCSIVLITHDRAFLKNVATDILEIDRGKIIHWKGDYDGFIQHKNQQLLAEEKANALFDKKLAQEEVWIRQGIKARRTRNEGRVRDLKKMRDERANRRKKISNLSMSQQSTSSAGKQVFVVDDISLILDNRTLLENFSTIIERGDKIGIVGPNACGKSTLIRCLLAEMPPSTGSVKQGTKLEIAYFDQHRHQLNPNATLIETVSGGSNTVTVAGKNKHIIGYLQDFLFTPEQARGYVRGLSGGEANRLLLAKLFATPSNFLILDEPTNDLDIESLELLEEYLLNYTGTILLISHDRSLLNHVATATWVFHKQRIIEYAGGYDETLHSHSEEEKTEKIELEKTDELTYEQRKLLNRLPDRIEKLERKIAGIHEEMGHPDFYNQAETSIQKTHKSLEEAEKKLADCYTQWESLSE